MVPAGRPGSATKARALAALLCHLTLVCVLLFPLPRALRTAIPNGPIAFDLVWQMYALSWESRALVTDPSRFFDAPVFHPTSHAVLYGPTGLGVLPIFAPVYLTTDNPMLAANVALLAGMALTAWTTHLVVRRWTGLEGAGFVAGATIVTAPWVARQWVPFVISYAALWWFPLIIARAARPMRRFRDAAVLAALAWLQALTDLAYIAPAVLAPLSAIALWRLVRPGERGQGIALLGVVAAVATGLMPLVAAHTAIRAANPQLAQQTVYTLGVVPGSLWHHLVVGPNALRPAAYLLLGAGTVLMASRRLRREARPEDDGWRAVVPWLVVCYVMSVNRQFLVGGHPVENVLFTSVERLVPALEVVRVPDRWRFGMLAALGLAAGLSLAECRRAVARWRLARAALPALALAGLLAWRVVDPGQPLRGGPASPALIEALRNGSGPLVEIPARPQDIFLHMNAMFHALYHHRPIVNGYSGYWPAGFPHLMELANQAPDPEAVARLYEEAGVGTYVVGRNLPPAQSALWRRAMAQQDGPWRSRYEDPFVFVVDFVPPEQRAAGVP